MNSLNFGIRRRAMVAATMTLLIVAAAGCANAPPSSNPAQRSDSSADGLAKRAQAYWDLIRTNDNVGAWSYEAESKDPRWSLERYLKKGGITYSTVKVLGVKSMEGDVALVDVQMKYSLPLLRVKDMEQRIEDRWKLIEGVWYHSPRTSKLLPGS